MLLIKSNKVILGSGLCRRSEAQSNGGLQWTNSGLLQDQSQMSPPPGWQWSQSQPDLSDPQDLRFAIYTERR